MRWFIPLSFVLSACPEPPPSCSTHEDCAVDAFCVENDFCLSVFDRSYEVAVLSGSVPSVGTTGGAWDPEDDSGPDLFALFGTTVEGQACATTTLTDTISGEWDESCEIDLTSGAGFVIELHDEDVNGQSTFIGGWGWEEDTDVVNLVRELSQVQTVEDGSYSASFRFDPPN